ncbi:NlpC/P60 family protein [Alicyclobacillus sp. TC]|nr:NlpC/P60 family protein [Alicyclobacillus sp. TC]
MAKTYHRTPIYSFSSNSYVKSQLAYNGQLPPGVTYQPSVQPLAGIHATPEEKFQAILTVAESKLGTPYRWGHNEDRGQYGFDCSNFTAYVYHHALGYVMSGASQVQYHDVGWQVPISDMQPGDLVIFNHGGHVAIYIGNGQMIEEGGGLGKVGIAPLHPGTYWYNHITTVKRMF